MCTQTPKKESTPYRPNRIETNSFETEIMTNEVCTQTPKKESTPYRPNSIETNSSETERMTNEVCTQTPEKICTESKNKINEDQNILTGEEVYLCHKGIDIFKAKCQEWALGMTVHGQAVAADERRFLITKLLKKANTWNGFDVDRTAVNCFVKWKVKDVRKMKKKEISILGTEATYATPITEKKRKRAPEKWKANVKKQKVNSGKEYSFVNMRGKKKGDIKRKEEKKVGPVCNEKCRNKCSKNISNEERHLIHKNFWSLNDVSLQRAFINSCVTVKEAKRKRETTKSGTTRCRNQTRTYSFLITTDTGDTRQEHVCAFMFLNTLDIDKERVRTALEKITATGTVEHDKRGKHLNHFNARDREVKVIEHISLFKTVESHYVRKDAKGQYLPEDLSVATMYRMYVEWCQENGTAVVEDYKFYNKVFRERFDLKFQKPKKDQCDRCCDFNNTPMLARTSEIIESQEKHLSEKELAREFKGNCKKEAATNPSILVCAFDLEKVQLCPHGQTSSFYYCKRLKNHNFTVTDINSMETTCYLWHEGEANKGACEVATCLYDCFSTSIKDGKKVIHSFCDRCGSQNCNKMIVIAISKAVRLPDIDEITLNFLVSGHSQNENDTAHSVIEKATNKRTIYTTAQWETAIQMASKSHETKVNVIQHGDIIDFQNPEVFPDYAQLLKDEVYEDGISTEQNGKLTKKEMKTWKVYWSRIMQMKVTKENPDYLYFKYSYSDMEFKTVKITNRCATRSQRCADIPRTRFEKPPGIEEDKWKSLMNLCEKNLIPAQHHDFFRNLAVEEKKVVEVTTKRKSNNNKTGPAEENVATNASGEKGKGVKRAAEKKAIVSIKGKVSAEENDSVICTDKKAKKAKRANKRSRK